MRHIIMNLLSRIFATPASSERSRWSAMAGKCRAGRGLRPGHLDGRFGEAIVLGCCYCYLSLQWRSTCRENSSRPLGSPFDDGIIDFFSCEVKLASNLLSLLHCPRGLRGRRRTGCTEREEGNTLVVSLDNSASPKAT